MYCRRHYRVSKGQLLINKMIMMNRKGKKTNVSMTRADYRKHFDMMPHSWLADCLQIYEGRGNHNDIFQTQNA